MSTIAHLVIDMRDPRYRKYMVAAAGFALQVLTLLLPDVPVQDKQYVSLAIAILVAFGVKATANGAS